MAIDPTASQGFQAGATAYASARPGYPAVAVAWLVENLRIGPGARVLDLGAGTGKLTELLAPSGARLLAIEPVGAMRAHLARSVPSALVAGAAAEALPFRDGVADAVVAAQAFHWFDGPRALREIRRVLGHRRRLGLVWNVRDRSVGWVAEIADITDAHGDAIRRHESQEWRGAFPAPGFGPLHETEVANVQQITPEGIVERVASTSFIATLPDAERARVLARVREVLRSHPDTAGRDRLGFPHLTRAYWCERA